MNKKKKTIIIVALLLVVFIGSISYALWSVTLEQTDSNIVKTGCFETTMEEKTEALNLPEEFPIKDEEAEDYDPFTFTIKNTCTIDASYSVNLKVESGTDLDVQYLKTVLDNEEPRVLTDYEKATNEEKYQLTTGTLRGASSESADDGESVTYNLRLWLDENTPESQMSKTFNGKIVIESITTRASKVVATGDISATESDNVTYTLYEDGLLKISGTGATKDFEDNVFETVFAQYFENQCTEASLDCSALNIASPLQMYEIYANYDTAIEYMVASNQITQDQITQMGVTTDVELLEAMSGTDVDDDNFDKCVELLKRSSINITDLKIDAGITSLGERIFMTQDYITLVDLSEVDLRLPSTISNVSEYAFYENKFNSITLNQGITTIDNYAFAKSGGITNFPSTIDLESSGTFYDFKFTNVVDLSSYSEIPDNQFGNASLNGIILGENLKRIGQGSFANSGLTGELIIPDSVEVIGKYAFNYVQITSLKLPENDVYHGITPESSDSICEQCTNLKEVELPLNVYNIEGAGYDLIWGSKTWYDYEPKYIMPIKASEYGENYRIYSYSSSGYKELGAVTELPYTYHKLEWQPE